MAVVGRAKGQQGSTGLYTTITPTTAVAFPILDELATYIVGGTGLVIPSIATTFGTQPGRQITFIGDAGCSVTFTNTPATSTAGLMDLGVDDVLLQAKDTISLMQMADGSWTCINRTRAFKATATTGNDPGTTLVTTATALAIPDDRNVFFIKAAGAATLPGLTTTKNIAPGRVITLVCDTSAGGAITLTNDGGGATTTNGKFELGAADVVLGTTDSVQLVQRADGVWQKIGSADC